MAKMISVIVEKKDNLWELTSNVLCEFESDEEIRADYRELHSTENNLKTAIYYDKEENYYYTFIEA